MPARRLDPQRLLAAVTEQRAAIGAEPYSGPVSTAALGADCLDLVIEETHSCYLGDRSHRHAWGYGCGKCPACKLRAEGFARFTAA